jgi:hypothetical protein
MKTEKQINHYLNKTKTEYAEEDKKIHQELDLEIYRAMMVVRIETLEWVLNDLGPRLKRGIYD